MTTLEGVGIAVAAIGLTGHMEAGKMSDPMLFFSRRLIDILNIVSTLAMLVGLGLVAFGSGRAWWARIIEVVTVVWGSTIASIVWAELFARFYRSRR